MFKVSSRVATLLRNRLSQESSSALKTAVQVRHAATQKQESDSFAMGMFQGLTKTSEVFPFPNSLSPDEKDLTRELMEPAEKFLNEVNDAMKNDTMETIPDDVWNQAKEMGVLGALVPPEYGGLGLKNTQYAKLTEVVGAADLGFGIAMGAHQSIGYKGIYLFGTDQQKKKYLPDLCAGKKLAAFCLTEPSSGSDAASIKCKAVKSDDGKHYILNGGKLWISNGGIAEIFTVFAQTPVKDEKTGAIKVRVLFVCVNCIVFHILTKVFCRCVKKLN